MNAIRKKKKHDCGGYDVEKEKELVRSEDNNDSDANDDGDGDDDGDNDDGDGDDDDDNGGGGGNDDDDDDTECDLANDNSSNISSLPPTTHPASLRKDPDRPAVGRRPRESPAASPRGGQSAERAAPVRRPDPPPQQSR